MENLFGTFVPLITVCAVLFTDKAVDEFGADQSGLYSLLAAYNVAERAMHEADRHFSQRRELHGDSHFWRTRHVPGRHESARQFDVLGVGVHESAAEREDFGCGYRGGTQRVLKGNCGGDNRERGEDILRRIMGSGGVGASIGPQ